MYTPKVYVADEVITRRIVDTYPFGLMVTRGAHGLAASHIPFMFDRDRGERGTLVAHVAKANPQWRDLDGADVMVVFSGPDAYVSPSWYEDQVTVPTWNYVAVHMHGVASLVRDPDALRAMVERLTHEHERRVGSPWRLAQADPVLATELRGIVGFEISVQRIDAKAKLNQNRSLADRQGVADALSRSPDDRERLLAALMREQLDSTK
jgi:transcriptional regulator